MVWYHIFATATVERSRYCTSSSGIIIDLAVNDFLSSRPSLSVCRSHRIDDSVVTPIHRSYVVVVPQTNLGVMTWHKMSKKFRLQVHTTSQYTNLWKHHGG